MLAARLPFGGAFDLKCIADEQEEIEVLRKHVESAEELGTVIQGGLSLGERTLMVEQMRKLELQLERCAEQKCDLEDSLDSTAAELTLMAERVLASQRETFDAQTRLHQVQGQMQQLQGDPSGARSREEDLSLIRQLQDDLEQVVVDNGQKDASLASMQDRVATAELARNRLRELVMQLETDARRLTAEKLKLSHQVAHLTAQLCLLPSTPQSSTGQSAHQSVRGSEAESGSEQASFSDGGGSVVPRNPPAAKPAAWDERGNVIGKAVVQEGWQPKDCWQSLAPPPLPQPKQSGTYEEAGRLIADAGAGVAEWQERNAVDASDAGASDLERGGLDTLEHFLSRPLQDFAFPELAPLVSIPLLLPLTNSLVVLSRLLSSVCNVPLFAMPPRTGKHARSHGHDACGAALSACVWCCSVCMRAAARSSSTRTLAANKLADAGCIQDVRLQLFVPYAQVLHLFLFWLWAGDAPKQPPEDTQQPP